MQFIPFQGKVLPLYFSTVPKEGARDPNDPLREKTRLRVPLREMRVGMKFRYGLSVKGTCCFLSTDLSDFMLFPRAIRRNSRGTFGPLSCRFYVEKLARPYSQRLCL
ncbi:hypothetical protein NPIL_586661 [Nephila pilipes]|uniref:Uncharacterized protein n=1 Tax=Nephila pilipes TaxID=299642 RepID=A0A8X6M7I4_NEPPI|nr:hypothetical protein NPIL_586661 [Nephila pilipes]